MVMMISVREDNTNSSVVYRSWFGAGGERSDNVTFVSEMVISETCILTPLCKPTVCERWERMSVCMVREGV